MSDPLPIPEELQHLLEKRIQDERRKKNERRSSQPATGPSAVDVERRTGTDRRHGRRRLDD